MEISYLRGLPYQKVGLFTYTAQAVPSQGLSAVPSEGNQAQTKTQCGILKD